MTTAAAHAQEIGQRFHALSDPTRLEILNRLRHGERCVCDLMDLLDAAQSRLSFHLKVLKESGLVTDRRDGRWIYYTMNPDAVAEMSAYLDHMKPTARALRVAVGACCD